MRRVLIVLTVAGLVVLAGCTVGGNVGTPTDDSTATETSTTTESPETATTTTAETSTQEASNPDGELEIHHIDVGQADSTLIITPDNETILIDTGDWRQDGEEVIAYLDAHDIERIDHLVSTHAHADHIGGHAAVIEHYETELNGVGAAYDSGVVSTSQTYERYLDAIETHEVDLFEVQEGDELPLDEDTVTASILNPPAGDSGEDLHENSVVLVIEMGDFRYLTTGDAETPVEDELREEWSDEFHAQVYQAGHHGSSTSSSSPFLDAVSPEIAIISSGYDSQYGHPHDEVLERFADRDIETYWTAVHGNIVVTTNGESIDIETEESFSTDPHDLLAEKPDDQAGLAQASLSTPATVPITP